MSDGNGGERETRDIVTHERVEGIPMMPINELKKLTAYVNEVKKTLMMKGKDYVIEGNRQFTTRSGFAKLAQGFRLSDDRPEITVLYYDEPQTFEFVHRVRGKEKREVVETKIRGFEAVVKVVQLETGRYAHGEGSCTVEELHMTNNMSPKWYHRCLGTAKTRAWNRAISNFVGSADVSAEEMGFVYDEEPSSPSRKQVDSEVAPVESPIRYGRTRDEGAERVLAALELAGLDPSVFNVYSYGRMVYADLTGAVEGMKQYDDVFARMGGVLKHVGPYGRWEVPLATGG